MPCARRDDKFGKLQVFYELLVTFVYTMLIILEIFTVSFHLVALKFSQ